MLIPAVLAFATLAAGAYSDAAGKPSPYGAIKQYDTGTYGPELKLEHLFYNQARPSTAPLFLARKLTSPCSCSGPRA